MKLGESKEDSENKEKTHDEKLHTKNNDVLELFRMTINVDYSILPYISAYHHAFFFSENKND